MNFIIEQYESKSYLTCPLSEKAGTDPMLMGMLMNNHIPGFGKFSIRSKGDTQCLCYDIDGLRSMKDIFAVPISRQILLNTFGGILAALETAQDYMIESSSVVLDPQYVFINPTTFSIALICLPLMEYRNGTDEKSFFKSIMFSTIFDYTEPCDHVARIMNYLNGSAFSPEDFRKLLEELGANYSAPEEVSPSQPDPFFEFDSFRQPEKKIQLEPALFGEASHNTPMQEAEALLSAALLQPDPSTNKTEYPSQQNLASDPIVQRESAESVEEAPVPSASLPSEGSNSVRSRRSRARKEGRESRPSASVVPVREAPKTPVGSNSGSYDFLDGFASTGRVHKTDAMKAADAILSSLDLPVGDVKETPIPDPFPDFTATNDSEAVETFDDSFDDFTTPIISSRKRSDTAASKPATKSRKETSAPVLSRNEGPTEPFFDFSTPAKKPASPTDAMKIADDLLSAALSGISLEVPAAPVKEAPEEGSFTTSAPVASKKTAEDSFSHGLDFFSAPSPKKTQAMQEAEAILDSLDLFAGVPETSASGVCEASDPPSKATVPVPQEETPSQHEPVRKGGFFSKLRKKDEAPAPPAQPVIPYFGSDGETTILNVAQQMVKPAAPYLVRSSNQETIVLSKAIFRVGKDRDFTDYCICDNSAISRRHANFMVRNGDVFIIDTNSTNHTYVNGVMIRSNTEVKLTHGDEIRLADEDFMLYCAGTL